MSIDEFTLPAADEFTLSDAAYILGALSPDERREYEAHLADCLACARSVADLAGLPALMSAVSVDLLTEAGPPPETLLPALAQAMRRRRGRHRRAAGALAAAAAFLTAVGAVGLTRPDSPARQPSSTAQSGTTNTQSGTTKTQSGTANLALAAVVPSPVTASARLVDTAWGTRVDLTCAYRVNAYRIKGVEPGSALPYALVIIDRSGAAERVATWKALPDRELTVMGASSRTRQEIAAVEVRTLSGQPILRLTT